jgi:hypothetical protein
LDLDDTLEDGRAVLGVGIDQPLDVAIEALLEHLFLNLHDLLEDSVDVCLSVHHTV